MKKISIVLLVVTMMMVSGCTNSYYTESQSEKIEEEGKLRITEYLEKECKGYVLNEVYMCTGATIDGNPYAGYYLSNCVNGYFKYNDMQHQIAVNLETGEIYTDLYQDDICAYLEGNLKEKLEDSGFTKDIVVDDFEVDYRVVSHNVQAKGNQKLDTECHIENVFPATVGKEQVAEYLESGCAGADFRRMIILFSAEEKETFPIHVVEEFCESNPFYAAGEIQIVNLNRQDFEKIQSGELAYNYQMEKIEDLKIYP